MGSLKRMPVRKADIAFDGIYAGFTATLRLNVAYGTKLDLAAGGERFEKALKAIVVEWDLVDEEGKPIAPGEAQPVPDDLLSQLVQKWGAALEEEAKLPKA